MKLVFEYDPAAAGAFVVAAKYPNKDAIAGLVAGDAAVLRVDGARGVCGYFWFFWTAPKEMALYACVPVRRGLWTRRVLGDLHKFPELLGARRLVAVPPDAAVAVLLRRMGWVAADPGDPARLSIPLPNHWSARYGRDFPIHFQRAAVADAAPSGRAGDGERNQGG